MSDLIVVSNRGPVSIGISDDDELVVDSAGGGLAPSLARALSGRDALWIAAAMTEGEKRAARGGISTELSPDVSLDLLDLPVEVLTGAYNVVANHVLWFLYHGMFDTVRRPNFDRRFYAAWESYRTYNHAFFEEIAKNADEGATVVVHDYHLSLVGRYLANGRPDLRTVHFSHTPFPTPEELSILPGGIARELVDGLASFGSCGFHTHKWRDAFQACATEVLGRPQRAFAAALGPDVAELEQASSSASVQQRRHELMSVVDGRRLIVRSDRIEPSKNLVRGFLAFEELLERDPLFTNETVFLARVYPSRTSLPEYLAYRKEVEEVVNRINERFGSKDRPPVLLEIGDDYQASLAAFGSYDVLVVNPLRDGMNLVAKEGPILNQSAGVLALSYYAGAYEELGRYALGVHPFDISGTATALECALGMSHDERQERGDKLATVASSRPPSLWFDDVAREAAAPNVGPTK